MVGLAATSNCESVPVPSPQPLAELSSHFSFFYAWHLQTMRETAGAIPGNQSTNSLTLTAEPQKEKEKKPSPVRATPRHVPANAAGGYMGVWGDRAMWLCTSMKMAPFPRTQKQKRKSQPLGSKAPKEKMRRSFQPGTSSQTKWKKNNNEIADTQIDMHTHAKYNSHRDKAPCLTSHERLSKYHMQPHREPLQPHLTPPPWVPQGPHSTAAVATRVPPSFPAVSPCTVLRQAHHVAAHACSLPTLLTAVLLSHHQWGGPKIF